MDEEGDLSLRRVLVTAIVIVIAAVLTVILIRSLLVALVLFGGGGDEVRSEVDTVDCYRVDGLRVEWLASDNITGYDDISESQKQDLSNDTVEELRRMAQEPELSNPYNDTNYANYTDLSDAQKDLFRDSLNDTETYENASRSLPPRVIYRGDPYFCF
jgi:hypothetical protein